MSESQPKKKYPSYEDGNVRDEEIEAMQEEAAQDSRSVLRRLIEKATKKRPST